VFDICQLIITLRKKARGKKGDGEGNTGEKMSLSSMQIDLL
jgi:hypothetical protein